MGLRQIKVELTSFWGGDRDAANAAWASSTDVEKLATRSDEDVRRVVSNLVTLAHDTPKERLWLEFFITCPIFVERQYDKYRMTTQIQDAVVDFNVGEFGRHGITQNELSGRYRTIPERPYYMPKDVTDIMDAVGPIDEYTGILPSEYASHAYLDFQEEAFKYYNSKLRSLKAAQDRGDITNVQYKRARDVLRGLLPLSTLTDMRIVMNANAFEWILNQRLPDSSQTEARVVAYHMFQQVIQQNVATIMFGGMSAANGWGEHLLNIAELIGLDVS